MKIHSSFGIRPESGNNKARLGSTVLTTTQADSEELKTREVKGESIPEASHPKGGSLSQCPFFNAMAGGDADQLRSVATETIADRVFGDQSFQKAEKVLRSALAADPEDKQGKTNHLLGLTFFHQEKWGDATRALEVAAERDPSNQEIQKLLNRAKENLKSNIGKPMHSPDPLDPDKLKAPPILQLREPEGIKPAVQEERNFFVEAGERVVESLGSLTVNSAIGVAGAFADNETMFGFNSWDARSDARGLLEMGAIRHKLNTEHLHSTYQGPVAHQQPGQKRPEWTERFRTATGAWTTDEPMEGAVGTEFQRTGAPLVGRESRALDPSLPSVREVSRVLFTAEGERAVAPFLNNLTIAWIQFQTHDWVSHRPAEVEEGAFQVPLADDDPYKKKYGVNNMFIPKTSRNPLPQDGKLTYANEVTHWWDASHIYGSDQATQDRLRTGADGKILADGKLRMDGEELPLNPETGIEDTGFTRNWWVGLGALHTLFAKNHNSIASKLKAAYPDWSSDQLFNTSRMINAAMLAKIHTVEWTPAVLPNNKLTTAMDTNWWGNLETNTKPFEERRIHPAFAPKDPVIGGIAGGTRNNHAKPYGLSEEFTEVYRLHAGMMDHLNIRPPGDNQVTGEVSAEGTRGANSRALLEEHGTATMLNSMGYQKMNALVNNNYPAFMQDMSVAGQAAIDLGAIDLMRARERGVPPYNEFRREIGLNPIESFEDLGADAETVKKLESLYGEGPEGVEKLDLLAGTLTEARRPSNYGFGETIFQVFIQMATRRIEADPFLTDKLNAEHYTPEGMEMIETATMKGILLEHYPELEESGLIGVNNAFEPWGTNVVTHPEEHPLSAGAETYLKQNPGPAPIRMIDKGTGEHYVVNTAQGRVNADLNDDGKFHQTETVDQEDTSRALSVGREFRELYRDMVPGTVSQDGRFELRGELTQKEERGLAHGEKVPIERKALQLHLDFYDKDRDGKISLKENYKGFRDIGFGRLKAGMKAGMSSVIFGKMSEGFAIDIDTIGLNRYAGTTGIYDKDGRLDRERLGEFTKRFDELKRPLAFDEVLQLLQDKVEDPGTISKGQFGSLFDVCKHLNSGEEVVTKQQFIGLFEGSLLWQAASATGNHGKRGG